MSDGNLSDRAKGSYRDKRILEVIESHKCLNAAQVQALIFNITSGKRKCQQRLKKLTDRGKLRRWRYVLEEPYAYYLDFTNKVEQMEHTVLLNWLLVWLEVKKLENWEIIHSFSYEPTYTTIRPDAFVAIQNTFTKEYSFMFIELDRGWSGNKFDKVIKYNDFFESDAFSGEWWVQHTKRFPVVLIATTTHKRARKINDIIKRENRNGLEFKVYVVDDLRNEVIE